MLTIGGLACLVCVLILLRRFYFSYRKRNIAVPKLQWVDILRLFNDTQMMPIEHARGWTLQDIVHGVRVYTRKGTLNAGVATLHASATKIKASSALVLSLLREYHRQLDWNISVQRPLSVTESGSGNSGDQSQASNSPGALAVNHDVIKQRRRYTVTDERRRWSLIRRWRSHYSLSPLRIIHRYWYREENGCCWLLELDEEQSVWTLYVMQPCTEGWFANKCVMTIISSGVHYSLPATRLACLRDAMTLKRLQRSPIVRLTTTAGGDQPQPRQQKQQQKPVTTPSTSAAESADEEPSLLQRFKRIIDEKKEIYEQAKRRKALQGSSEASTGSMADIIVGLLSLNNSTPAAAAASANSPPATTAQATASRAIKPPATVKDGKSEVPAVASETDLRRGKTTSKTTLVDDGGSGSPLKSPSPPADVAQNVRDSGEEKPTPQRPMRKSQVQQSTVVQQMEEMTATADSTAICVIMEKTNVSHLNIRSSLLEQAKQSGGWTYCGLKKDVVVLRKMHLSEKISMHSYLGKGVIPCDPKLVFDIIREPQKRTCYDEMATLIDVIHEFSSDMKVVYIQCEVPQLFKKECLDFCVLQSDKQDGVQYIVTMQSVDWPDCPTHDSITRVKLMHSGWIIEPVMQNDTLHSMVTYLFQMEFGQPKSKAAGALDEMASRQPLCIFNLRQYVTSAQMSEVATSEVTTP